MAAPASSTAIEELLRQLDLVPPPSYFHRLHFYKEEMKLFMAHQITRPEAFAEIADEMATVRWGQLAQFAKKEFIQKHKSELRKKKLEILANCGGEEEFIKLLKDAMFTYKHPDLL